MINHLFKVVPNLFLDPTPCNLLLITIKCKKFTTMNIQALFDFGSSTCFIDKELVWQHKLALTKIIIVVIFEIIDGRSLFLINVTHERNPSRKLTFGHILTKMSSVSFHLWQTWSSLGYFNSFCTIHGWIGIQ